MLISTYYRLSCLHTGIHYFCCQDVVLNAIEKQLQNYYSVSCGDKEIGQNEHVTEEKVDHAHTPPSDSYESVPRKKRKVEEELVLDDFEVRDLRNSDQSPETKSEWSVLEESIDSDKSILAPEKKSSDNKFEMRRIEPPEKTSGTCQLPDRMHMHGEQHTIDNSFSFSSACQGSRRADRIVEEISKYPKEIEIHHVNMNDLDSVVPTTEYRDQGKSKVDSEEIQAQEISNPNELEHLWESVTTNDINEISMCLDALESASQLSSADECNKVGKGADIVGSVAWSMGRVSLPTGDTMKVR